MPSPLSPTRWPSRRPVALDLTFDDASRGSDGGSEFTRNALGARWVRESVARVREARATLAVPSVDRRLFVRFESWVGTRWKDSKSLKSFLFGSRMMFSHIRTYLCLGRMRSQSAELALRNSTGNLHFLYIGHRPCRHSSPPSTTSHRRTVPTPPAPSRAPSDVP